MVWISGNSCFIKLIPFWNIMRYFTESDCKNWPGSHLSTDVQNVDASPLAYRILMCRFISSVQTTTSSQSCQLETSVRWSWYCELWQTSAAAGFHYDKCHLLQFHLLFNVMDKFLGPAKGLCHQDVCLKKSSWHLISQWGVSFFFFLALVMQRYQLCLVSQQKVKLHDWLDNVCWHGDQLSLLRKLVLMRHKITAAFACDATISVSLNNLHISVSSKEVFANDDFYCF